MAGGPTVNLLIAFFIFLGVFSLYGSRTIEPDAGRPVIDTVSACVLPYAEEGRACRTDDPPTPAVEAGLRPGDVITTFNGDRRHQLGAVPRDDPRQRGRRGRHRLRARRQAR